MSDFEEWSPDDEPWKYDGAPSLTLFGNALQVWSLMQPGAVTVADAARVFNVPPMRIVQAVEAFPWMFLEGPSDDYTKLTIEHEGE